MFRDDEVERRRRSMEDIIARAKLVSLLAGIGSIFVLLIVASSLGYVAN